MPPVTDDDNPAASRASANTPAAARPRIGSSVSCAWARPVISTRPRNAAAAISMIAAFTGRARFSATTLSHRSSLLARVNTRGRSDKTSL
jgi:hypothetical protein